MATNPRWTNRPEGSTWGDWGPDDQLGRLNLLTPERRRRAAAEVVEGIAFGLSLPLVRRLLGELGIGITELWAPTEA